MDFMAEGGTAGKQTIMTLEQQMRNLIQKHEEEDRKNWGERTGNGIGYLKLKVYPN